MSRPRLAALWRWLAILLLIAMGATGLASAAGSWPYARGAGQRVQSASQWVYSVSALLAAVSLAARWPIARLFFLVFALSATIAAALAPVVWGGTSWWTGAVAAVAALAIAWLVSYPFRRQHG
jgi:hypothetical protein